MRVRIRKPVKASVIEGSESEPSKTRERRNRRVERVPRIVKLRGENNPPVIEMVPLTFLKPAYRNGRTHSNAQVQQLANSIKAFGFVVPVVVDENLTILAGHGRYEAADKLGLMEVPVVRVKGLSEARRRAFALADNKIAENAGWDRKILAAELPELAELLIDENLDIAITGFAPVEIDQIMFDFEMDSSDPLDVINPQNLTDTPVSQPGDLWRLGPHLLLSGDARDGNALKRLLGNSRAAMAFLDPPYNVRVKSVVGRGRIKHSEFAMASGELRSDEFVSFLKASLSAAAAVSREGAVHFVCSGSCASPQSCGLPCENKLSTFQPTVQPVRSVLGVNREGLMPPARRLLFSSRDGPESRQCQSCSMSHHGNRAKVPLPCWESPVRWGTAARLAAFLVLLVHPTDGGRHVLQQGLLDLRGEKGRGDACSAGAPRRRNRQNAGRCE